MQDNFEISKEFNLPQEETKKMKLNKNLIAFIGMGLLILIFLGYFGYQYIAPFGTEITYQFTSDKNSDKVSRLIGADKSGTIETNAINSLIIPQQTIRNNIVTFNLKLLSKKLEGVWVNLKFKGNPKEIKIGVKGSEKEDYLYKPLYQQQLEQLKTQVANNNLLFWQKESIYSSLEQLVGKPPIDKMVATYFFDLGDFSLSQKKTFSVAERNTIFARALRGTHTFLILVNKKPLNIIIDKQDSNAYKGTDVLLVELYKGTKRIMKKEMLDDGISNISNLKMKPQTEQIKIGELDPGVYKLILTDKSQGADVNINKIEVNQPALVVSSPFYILDDRPATVWTDSKKIIVTTWHNEGLQTIKLDKLYDLKIDKKNENYEFNLNKPETTDNIRELHQLEIPKNDLVINGDGYFSFSEKSFFNPEPIKTVDLFTITDISKIDYIIANYQKVKKDRDLKIAQIYFDPKDIKIDGDKLYFSLESPGLSQSGGEIAISSLEVTVDKPGWFGAAPEDKSGPVNNESGIKNNAWNTITSPFVGAWRGTTGFLGGIWNSTANFFGGIWPFKTENNESGIKNNAEPTKAPTNTPTPTPVSKDKLKISVENGGAVVGAATKYADLLKKEGFKNVEPITLAKTDYKDATILYNKDDEKNLEEIIGEIKNVLDPEYKTINTDFQEDKGSITIILGALLKVTPTPIESGPTPTASPSAL